ncbi:uncharacterized protein CANTADRAFT_26184 [Suhomyces tanzawaensis NRRL Y-17324]|uniref:Uncharacterized protein n=1 Tax=Suhomyces tanzawaensis NRRL Y-17324 TaxID=984487 RepID=A0A1E4SIA6_9ASCO|nr:uncharacterized protein CANTADRAFT_26184 [Suhomyces tanzawaensis NRRL Y-17324]ODV79152.1 hypothetical protein CANTADRAFT_26184 [Suhomyces tanzawaensis NRRL Y-17324]
MTKTLEIEKEREAQINEQTIEVDIDGLTEVVRPEAIHIRGVDSLSTEDIKGFIDYYVNFEVKQEQDAEGEPKTVYEPFPIDDQITFRIQWINDTSVNVVFETPEFCRKALNQILVNPIEGDGLEGATQESQAKSYTPILAFRKHQNLLSRLGLEDTKDEEQSQQMEEDESSIELKIRQAFQSDKKVKNAREYSRYYLIHGEPERRSHRSERPERSGRRPDRYKSRGRNRGGRNHNEEEEEDLFAHKLAGGSNTAADEEEDLFAHKLRDRSPQRNRSRSPMALDR